MANNIVPSPMSDAFHDWLEQCPNGWVRLDVHEDWVDYQFDIKEK